MPHRAIWGHFFHAAKDTRGIPLNPLNFAANEKIGRLMGACLLGVLAPKSPGLIFSR
jgi:hypothetical protein